DAASAEALGCLQPVVAVAASLLAEPLSPDSFCSSSRAFCLLGSKAGARSLPGAASGRPCKARHLAQALWAGEPFYMQIDAHMRFVPGWDTLLRDWLAVAERDSPKAVISTYPPGYEGTGAKTVIPECRLPTLLCAAEFGKEGLLRFRARKLRQAATAPVPSLFWAAGFSFSRSLSHPVLGMVPLQLQ
ncbi:hypothetical protein CYMTET_30163, partial [Cymbomonas tetramitiformis]